MIRGLHPRSVGSSFFASMLVCALAVGLPLSTALSWPAGVDHSIFRDETDASAQPTVRPSVLSGVGDDGGDAEWDGTSKRIVGVSLLGSGIFLCSWGITSWEVREYQCCPARNTDNVIKIVAGVVLINAGLIYLLGVDD